MKLRSPRRDSISGSSGCSPLLAIATLLALSGLPAFAQLSGAIGVSLELTASCRLVGSTSTSGINFGTLQFGSAPSTFSGQLTAQATDGEGGVGTTQLVCSPDLTGITVSVSGGGNAGQGASIGNGARAMVNGNGDFVPYDVYADAGHTSAYPANGSTVSVTIPSDGSPFTLPVYGLVDKTSSFALPTGNYTDTLTVTITW